MRGEFSAGSTTEMYENTVDDFTTATRVYKQASLYVSTTIEKEVGVTDYYYWLRHVLVGGSASDTVTLGPLRYTASA